MRDLDAIAAALRRALPQGERVTGIAPLTTGFSNDTYRIEGADLILRLPPAAGAMLDGHDVVAQARIYAELGALPDGPPVPRIELIGEDAALLGSKFFVMERIPGEAVHDIDMQPWFTGATDAVRAAMCRNWIAAFAGLSRLQPLACLGAPVSPEDDLRMWRRFAESADCPRLVAAMDRLLAVPAPRSGAPAVVHGDPKLSNLMWRDHAIAAVLDWEMALNGEPLADLGYMLAFFASEHHAATRAPKLGGMLARDAVIAQWAQVSGRSPEGVFWHEIAQLMKVAAIIAEGTNMWNTGRSSDPKLALFKQNLDYYLGVVAAMLDGGGFRQQGKAP